MRFVLGDVSCIAADDDSAHIRLPVLVKFDRVAQLESERYPAKVEVASSSLATITRFRERRMDREGVNKVKAEIVRLRKIANVLPPGAIKVALAKRAAELGKSISPYAKNLSA